MNLPFSTVIGREIVDYDNSSGAHVSGIRLHLTKPFGEGSKGSGCSCHSIYISSRSGHYPVALSLALEDRVFLCYNEKGYLTDLIPE